MDRDAGLIQLRINDRVPGLHLLYPYAWTLAAQALSEGLARRAGNRREVGKRNAEGGAIMSSPEEIATTLQLLVLNERTSISYGSSADNGKWDTYRKKKQD